MVCVFVGSAVVDWLVFSQLALTRVEAVTLASALQDEGCMRAVGVKSVDAVRNAALGEQFLDDSTALYSFVGFSALLIMLPVGVSAGISRSQCGFFSL